jgi:hypothetical protein
MGPVHMRMPAVTALAIFTLMACELGMGSRAVSTGDLLLFNYATASIVVSLACVYTPCTSRLPQLHGRTAGISKQVHVLLCPPHQTALPVLTGTHSSRSAGRPGRPGRARRHSAAGCRDA